MEQSTRQLLNSSGPRNCAGIAPILLTLIVLVLGLLVLAGCSGEPGQKEKESNNSQVTDAEIAKLEKDSKELLSAPESAVKTTKVLEADKLDTYGIGEATLGTLKGDIDKAKSAGIEQILVVEGTREDGEKMYVIWKKTASGDWSP